MKAKQLLKNLYNDLERITKLIDNISNDVEKTISQTREETIRGERKRIYFYVEERLLGSDDELYAPKEQPKTKLPKPNQGEVVIKP